jgi:ABC-type sugar transport system ATPase subunit
MTDAISVSGLVKTFGRTRALDGLDLSVATGEVHGFLGHNGADIVLRVLERPAALERAIGNVYRQGGAIMRARTSDDASSGYISIRIEPGNSREEISWTEEGER